jgi:YD repeat-containing protein
LQSGSTGVSLDVPHGARVSTLTRQLSPSRRFSWRLCQTAEHSAEKSMAPRGLSEGTHVCQKPRHAGLAACRMEAVDKIREWKQGEVLRERHTDREPPRVDRDASSYLVERQTEDRTVHRVDSKPRDSPCRSASDDLSEHCDIGVVAAKESLV